MAVKRIASDLARSEDGAAYTLSYVLVFPILMLLVAVVVESALMMTAKLGTVHAAYVAARVAGVQSTRENWAAAEQRIEVAARRAMTAFASGSSRGGGTGGDDDDYRRAYREWVDDPVADGYVTAKQHDLASRLAIDIGGQPSAWDSAIVAEVTYDYPFRVPGIGRLIGQADGDGGFTYPLTTRVTLPNDAPQNSSQTLGIGYGD